jgi:hypothetical protein
LKTIGTVKAGGQNPDAIFYDAGSKRFSPSTDAAQTPWPLMLLTEK